MSIKVIVGNIGTVYSGGDKAEAETVFNEYVEQSKTNYGRASGETVEMIVNHEIKKEFIGEIDADKDLN